MRTVIAFSLFTAMSIAPSIAHADDCSAYNSGGSCSTTEAMFDGHYAGCYSCMVNNYCLDSSLWGVTGQECEDLVGVAQGGARAGTSRKQICYDLISCMFRTGCGSIDVDECYCGSMNGAACAVGPSANTNGLCKQQELDAVEMFDDGPNGVAAAALSNTSLAGGMANMLASCADGNNCYMCTE